jgi:uncharacterized protein
VLDLVLLPDDYAVCRLDPSAAVPAGLDGGKGVVSVTWTEDEISIICPAGQAPSSATVNAPWRCFRVSGPLDLALTGIMAALVTPLADARVNVFVFSTYDTDYVLVPAVRLEEAQAALGSAGHRISPAPGASQQGVRDSREREERGTSPAIASNRESERTGGAGTGGSVVEVEP